MKRTEKLQQQYLLQNTARLKLEEIDGQRKKTQTGNEQLLREAAELDSQITEIGEQKKALLSELADSQERERKLEAEITERREALEGKRRLQEAQNDLTAKARTRSAELTQRETFAGDNVKRLEREIKSFREEEAQLQADRQGSGDEVSQKTEQITQIEETIAHASLARQETQTQIEALAKERQEVSDAHKNFFEKREALSGQMSSLDKERYRLESQKERLEDYRERQINYMWEEYGLTASEAAAFEDKAHENPAQLKKRISELKGEIKALGPVNVNAIEEYKETAERHKFLTEQHDDLVKAGEALKDIIKELDTGMRKQFAEKFSIMQTEFSKSFKELFGGGHGTLELVEDEDILEAGIRIIAQPPGKKLQNMMQMSGGEKALTAIALLFAIQNMKPSPFCLLDEIEAALDENNVARYAGYLKKLTKNTQFIIITHRRGTMAAADRLYGITMQEKGVSTQVSVNMVEEELDK